MNTFELCMVLLSFIHYDSALGLRIFFPKNTDAIDDTTERPLTNQNDFFERNEIDVIPDDIERRIDPLLNSDENWLDLTEELLSDKQENPKDNTLEKVKRSSFNMRSSLFNHLRGAHFPFILALSKNHNVPVAPGFFPALNYRRYNMYKNKHQHRPQPQRNFLSLPSKRKSAITPPSRDWCRLIGYRVCPRATKF